MKDKIILGIIILGLLVGIIWEAKVILRATTIKSYCEQTIYTDPVKNQSGYFCCRMVEDFQWGFMNVKQECITNQIMER